VFCGKLFPEMRIIRLGAIAAVAVLACGCFQSTTLIHVNADGSGTIEQTTIVTSAALRQLRQFANANDEKARSLDFFSETHAQRIAESLGPDVTVASSARIKTAEGEGSKTVFAFPDINELQLKREGTDTGALGMAEAPQVHFALSHEANGQSLLRITIPPASMPPARAATAPAGSGGRPQSRIPPEQLAMVRQIFAGMRVAIAIEPAGHLVKTSSPFVDGNQVTLVDVAFDQLLANDAAFSRLQTARSIEDVRAAMSEVPGLKVNLDPEITIAFTPAR
jgi:hypothetical protein